MPCWLCVKHQTIPAIPISLVMYICYAGNSMMIQVFSLDFLEHIVLSVYMTLFYRVRYLALVVYLLLNTNSTFLSSLIDVYAQKHLLF